MVSFFWGLHVTSDLSIDSYGGFYDGEKFIPKKHLMVPGTPLGCYVSPRNQEVPLDSNDKGNSNCTWNSNQFEVVVSLVQVLCNGLLISIIFDQERFFLSIFVKFPGGTTSQRISFLK